MSWTCPQNVTGGLILTSIPSGPVDPVFGQLPGLHLQIEITTPPASVPLYIGAHLCDILGFGVVV
jgi:hypothetical protein